MTTENLESYIKTTKVGLYMELETFKRCATFRPTDTYIACEDKLRTVLICFDSHTDDAWWYFEDIYYDIPVQHRLRLMLEVVYLGYAVNYTSMLGYIDECVCTETSDMRKQRIEHNQKHLKKYINEDGTITLYRGFGDCGLLPEYAVSYTFDKSIAEFFIENHKLKHGSRFGGIYSRTVSMDKVLLYSNQRKEKEVFIIPDALDELIDCGDEVLEEFTLDLHNFEEYFPTEYAKFAAENDIKKLSEYKPEGMRKPSGEFMMDFFDPTEAINQT